MIQGTATEVLHDVFLYNYCYGNQTFKVPRPPSQSSKPSIDFDDGEISKSEDEPEVEEGFYHLFICIFIVKSEK